MTVPVYYNENDVRAASWLRELCREGLIPPGEIDTRSIEDVPPNDLRPFRQCHFFAGIGGWAYALRLVGWPDDREVWTGSCPCQPYSTAGKGEGTADERHLWPDWHYLIDERRPGIIFGEQVASKAALGWWDLVHADLALSQYASWATDLCAAGIDAPHIRQRLWFVAHRNSERFGSETGSRIHDTEYHAQPCRDLGQLAHGGGSGLEVLGIEQARGQRPTLERGGPACGLAHSTSLGPHRGWSVPADRGAAPQLEGLGTTSHWSGADWLYCRDEKWRPVEPGTFPLAHGVPARMGRLRGYGNAIVPQVAAEMIGTFMDYAGIQEQLG